MCQVGAGFKPVSEQSLRGKLDTLAKYQSKSFEPTQRNQKAQLFNEPVARPQRLVGSLQNEPHHIATPFAFPTDPAHPAQLTLHTQPSISLDAFGRSFGASPPGIAPHTTHAAHMFQHPGSQVAKATVFREDNSRPGVAFCHVQCSDCQGPSNLCMERGQQTPYAICLLMKTFHKKQSPCSVKGPAL